MRLPWATLLVLAVVIGIAIATGSWHGQLAPDLLDRFGCAPADLRDGAWWRLATSTVLTRGQASFPRVVFLVGVAGALYERRHGGLRMLGVAATVGIVVQTLAAVAFLPLREQPWALAMDGARDVGPSVGFYGLFGALLPELRGWRRAALLAAILAMTVVNVAWHLHRAQPGALEGDLEHAAAVVVGAVAAAIPRRRAAAAEAR